MALRAALNQFATANPDVYGGAKVWVFEADPDGTKSDRLATLYDGPAGTGTLANPQFLDSNGQWTVIPYVDVAVIITAKALPFGEHDTGVVAPGGSFRGDWGPSTVYQRGDTIRIGDAAAGGAINRGDLWFCVSDHTAGSSFQADADAGKWVVYVRVSEATTAAQEAEDWARKMTGTVDGTDYSAKWMATLAAASASDAASDALAAAASALAAANSADSIDDKYLGAKASAPLVDNDGDPLQAGMIYYNTGSNMMFVYDGASWTVTLALPTPLGVAAGGTGGTTAATARASLAAQRTIAVNVLDHGALGDGVADDTAAIAAAITAAKAASGIVWFPRGKYRVTTGNIALSKVSLIGVGSAPHAADYSTGGSVILIDGTSDPAFLIGDGVTIEGLAFFYPDQDDSATPPTVYPALFEGTYVVACLFRNVTVVNAYVAFHFSDDANGSIGDLRFEHCRIYGISKVFHFEGGAPEIIDIADCFFSHGVYNLVTLADGNYYLRDWTAENGAFIHIDVAGATNASVDGLKIANSFVYGYRYGIRIESGALNISRVIGTTFDATPTMLSLEGTARVLATHWIGCTSYGISLSEADSTANVFSIASTAAVGLLQVVGCTFSYAMGSIIFSNADAFDAVDIVGNTFTAWGQTTTGPAGYYAIVVFGFAARGTITGNQFRGVVANSNSPIAVYVGNVAALTIGQNAFANCFNCVEAHNPSGKVLVTGNTAIDTTGGKSLLNDISGTGVLEAVANSWDGVVDPTDPTADIPSAAGTALVMALIFG